jgi:hypothetical protein
MPVILALRRLRQEIVSFSLAWAIKVVRPSLKKTLSKIKLQDMPILKHLVR